MAHFEKLFSFIYGKNKYENLQAKLEYEVCDYFSKLIIPDVPSISHRKEKL